MAGIILTGAAGSGKTALAIEQILQAEADGFGQEIWVLLATRLQEEAFQDRLLAQAQYGTLFNIRFFNFYELYDLLLDMAGLPQRTISGGVGERLLREVIDDLDEQAALPYYDLIAQKSGFVQLVGSFIQELKQGLVEEEDFAHFAARHLPKDHDLAQIYTAYQNFLKDNHLVDRDGAGWVALRAVEKDPSLVQKVALLVVDGFDSFTPLQARLLAALADSVGQTLLTLTYEAHRQHEASRPFQHTLDRLQKWGTWEIHPHEPNFSRSAPLAHLEGQLFALRPVPRAAEGVLTLIEAPSPREEVKAVLRQIKRLLLQGVPPEKILVVMRDTATYAEPFRTVAQTYQIPVAVRQTDYLADNPAIRVLLSLLDVHQADFPRRPLLDLLRSPYLQPFALKAEDIATLERVSLEKPIVRGRSAWLNGLEAGLKADKEDGEEVTIEPALIEQLTHFFDALTPPESAPARDYVAWLENLLGDDLETVLADHSEIQNPDEFPPTLTNHLNFYGQVRDDTDSQIVIRDIYALQGFRSALLEVLAAYDLLETIQRIQQPIPWATFRADLDRALQNRRMSDFANRSRAGRVLITSVFEARGLPHDYVFMVGLAEGVFPQSQSPDPLYDDYERAALDAAGIDVETAADRSKDGGLFYQMCALAGKGLFFSRPTIDDSGNDWSPSIFWKETAALLTDPVLQQVKLGAAPSLEEVATLREAAVSLSESLNLPQEKILPSVWSGVAWLAEQPVWLQLQRGRMIENGRENRDLPFDHYSGLLADPILIAEVAEQLSEKRLWSASQLNEIGSCNFRFFSRRILGLDAYEEPEEGLDILKLGSLNHKILEDVYLRLASENIPITPENQAYALQVLGEVAQKIFATAPREFGFQVTRLWEQEKANLLEKLEQVIKLDFSPHSPIGNGAENRRIFRLEAPFGYQGGAALKMVGAAGELRVRGFIDRLDWVGDEMVVTDYKSGSHTPRKKDIEEGRNYQMLLYLLAVEQLLSREGRRYSQIRGLFWSLQTNKTTSDLTHTDEVLVEAQAQLHERVLAMRGGNFASQPTKLEGGKCSRFCEFSRLCRVNRASSRKPMPAQS